MAVLRVSLFACIASVVHLAYSYLLDVLTTSGDNLVDEFKPVFGGNMDLCLNTALHLPC